LLFLLCVALLLAAFGGYGVHRWQQFKQDQGILALDISGLRFHGQTLAASHLHVHLQNAEGRKLSVTAREPALTLASLRRLAAPRALTLASLDVQLGAALATRAENPSAATAPTLDDLQNWLAWLPQQIRIDSFSFSAPCAVGICSERGAFSLEQADNEAQTWTLQLQLERHPHRLAADATVRRNSEGLHLDLQLKPDQQPRLSLQGQLQPGDQTDRLSGSLALNGLPEAPWLLEWLADWVPHQAPALPELSEQMRLGASWTLRLPTGWLERGDWQTVDGQLSLSADVPVSWPLFDWGQVQGRLDLTANAAAGVWTPTSLAADLDLQPSPAMLAQLPAALRAARIKLQLEPGSTETAPGWLALQLKASGDAPLRMTLAATLRVASQPPLAMRLDEARLQLQAARLDFGDLRLRTLAGDLRLSGEADQQSARIALGARSQLRVASLGDGAELAIETLQADLRGIAIDAAQPADAPLQLNISGPLAVQAARLTHPSLRPQGWRWNGKLNATTSGQTLTGALLNDAGLRLDSRIERDAAGALRIAATLPEIFLRAGNPLAASLSDWPPLLELTTGRLQAQANLSLAAGASTPTVSATLSARSLGGIFDRTELSDLDAQLALRLQRNRLQLTIEELSLQQANAGLSFGPLQLRGDYQAELGSLGEGKIGWRTAETRILGGRFWLDPGSLELNGSQQPLSAHLRGLQLPLLLEAYPSEGLSGTGVIDGDFEIHHGAQGPSIEQGKLSARPPGGALQFRSARIQALGQSNQAMRLVTEALDDFHYDLLTSDVRYTSDGTLTLGLRLHGRNPALEGGRPVNFSINLEEDIPALLTSLQLSDRVSETIQRRVQQRLR
jgi:hypothetical protein